ncbi:MAG: hypothetical protein NZL93_06035 [Chthoniobacterales bacterium]|nr:hypothetical protein [Chthoniobacterales bacterium]
MRSYGKKKACSKEKVYAAVAFVETGLHGADKLRAIPGKEGEWFCGGVPSDQSIYVIALLACGDEPV